jgi:hypothetical protein
MGYGRKNPATIKIDNPNVAELESQLAQTMTNKRSMGVSILEYENYATKVNGTVTDWKPAIVKALSDLSLNVLSNKTLLFPALIYPILTQINLTSAHNGISFIGEGYKSEIKIADGATQGWMFNIIDANNPVKGITFSNLRLNGNKANTGNAGTTGFGIFLQQGTGIDNEQIFIDNIWTHDFLTSGLNIFSSNVIIGNVFSWNNGSHGIGIDVGKNIIIENANCINNGGYGIDWHGGQGIVNNVICTGNTSGGMKTSSGAKIYLTLTNAKLNYNGGSGFTTTLSHGSTYFFDNIEVIGNVNAGFRISEGDVANVGKIFASGNNTASETGSGQVQIDIPAVIDSIVIQNGNGYGLMINNSSRIDIKTINIQGCTNMGVYAYAANVSIISGRILNNCTLSGNYGIYLTANGTVKCKNVEIGDTNTTKKQTRGLYVDAGCTAIVIACDFRNCITHPIFDNDSTAIIAKNNIGYVTEKSGSRTASGNGATTTFNITHGLSTYIGANYINVLPSTADAKNNLASVTVDAFYIIVTYSIAPPTGTNNLVWYWEAKYNK